MAGVRWPAVLGLLLLLFILSLISAATGDYCHPQGTQDLQVTANYRILQQ
jgi:hypothetical protein